MGFLFWFYFEYFIATASFFLNLVDASLTGIRFFFLLCSVWSLRRAVSAFMPFPPHLSRSMILVFFFFAEYDGLCGIFDAKYIVVSSHPASGKLNGNRNYALPPCSMYGLRRVVGAFPSSAKYHKSKYQLLIHLVS
ncbi:unnamed protein product [Ixodes pacificus]